MLEYTTFCMQRCSFLARGCEDHFNQRIQALIDWKPVSDWWRRESSKTLSLKLVAVEMRYIKCGYLCSLSATCSLQLGPNWTFSLEDMEIRPLSVRLERTIIEATTFGMLGLASRCDTLTIGCPLYCQFSFVWTSDTISANLHLCIAHNSRLNCLFLVCRFSLAARPTQTASSL